MALDSELLDDRDAMYFSSCQLFGPLLSGEPDYFGRKKISSVGDLSHYSSASLY